MRNLGIWKCECGKEYVLAQNGVKLIMFRFQPVVLTDIDDMVAIGSVGGIEDVTFIDSHNHHPHKYNYQELAKEYIETNKIQPISPRTWWLNKFNIRNVQYKTLLKFKQTVNGFVPS